MELQFKATKRYHYILTRIAKKKKKRLTIPNVVMNTEQVEFSCTTRGQNGATTLGKSLAASFKVKYIPTIQPNNFTFKH